MPRNTEQTERERAAFQAFLKAFASFANQLDPSAPFQPTDGDFPDIVACTAHGTKIGFELGEWLHETQTRKAKTRGRLREKLQVALSSCASPKPRNFSRVDLHVKVQVRFHRGDTHSLRSEFSAVAAEVNERWPSEPLWQDPMGYLCDDFKAYPTLAKYLESTHFWPRDTRQETTLKRALDRAARDPEIIALFKRARNEALTCIQEGGLSPTQPAPTDEWIGFSQQGGAYSPESALAALATIIEKKLSYAPLSGGREVRLIIYYDEGALYNTPYKDLKFRSFADIAQEASRVTREKLGAKRSPFTRIYLLKALDPNPEAFEIWPTFSPGSQ